MYCKQCSGAKPNTFPSLALQLVLTAALNVSSVGASYVWSYSPSFARESGLQLNSSTTEGGTDKFSVKILPEALPK